MRLVKNPIRRGTLVLINFLKKHPGSMFIAAVTAKNHNVYSRSYTVYGRE